MRTFRVLLPRFQDEKIPSPARFSRVPECILTLQERPNYFRSRCRRKYTHRCPWNQFSIRVFIKRIPGNGFPQKRSSCLAFFKAKQTPPETLSCVPRCDALPMIYTEVVVTALSLRELFLDFLAIELIANLDHTVGSNRRKFNSQRGFEEVQFSSRLAPHFIPYFVRPSSMLHPFSSDRSSAHIKSCFKLRRPWPAIVIAYGSLSQTVSPSDLRFHHREQFIPRRSQIPPP